MKNSHQVALESKRLGEHFRNRNISPTKVITFRGGKSNRKAQGMWICWSGALKFDQNWIKHKKRRKKMPVFALFEQFLRFFNFGRILAHQTTKFTFLEVYRFFWHPTHLWMWLSSAWKKIWPYLAECCSIALKGFLVLFLASWKLKGFSVMLEQWVISWCYF